MLEIQGMTQVADATLSGTGTDVTATQKVATGLVQVADFTDADPNGTLTDYTASIDWGDKTTSTGQIQSDGNGGFVVLGDHTYQTTGSFNITTTINDAGGSSVVVTSKAQSSDPSATGISALEGQVFTFTDAIGLTLTAGQEPSASFTAAINWGDDTTWTTVSAEGEYKVVNGVLTGQILVTGDHIYTEDGEYTLTLTVTGSDGTK